MNTQNPLQIDWANIHRDYPLTVSLGVINLLIFILGKTGLIPPLVSIPGFFDLGTFGAHFFHHQLMHLTSNLLILLLVGRILEPRLRLGFLGITIAIWALTIGILWLFNDVPVYGFSGIAMGLLSYAMFECRKNPYWYQILWPMVLINILFGLVPGISWWGHLGGAVAGALVYGGMRLFKK